MNPHLQIAAAGRAAKNRKKILEIQGLRKVFDIGGDYLHVLEQITFCAQTGELICILGRSGCGKTTLLKILAGFIPPTDGKVLLNGQPVYRPGPDRCVVFQEDALFPWLTVQENIAFGMQGRGWTKRKKKEKVDSFLSMVGLSEFRKYLPREISGGMKQRVALARVLVLEPQVLLMDEPFAALDAQTREEMQNLLLSLWLKLSHTILFVTHDVQEAVALADRILLMEKDPGRVREDIRIDLSRPREKNTNRFLEFCGYLFDAIK